MGMRGRPKTMNKQGRCQLRWQQGNVAIFAEASVKIERHDGDADRLHGIEIVPPSWQVGVGFGFSLFRETVAGIADLGNRTVTITSFRGVPADTSSTAAAYATFHAIADALEIEVERSVADRFTFDTATGTFCITIPETSGKA